MYHLLATGEPSLWATAVAQLQAVACQVCGPTLVVPWPSRAAVLLAHRHAGHRLVRVDAGASAAARDVYLGAVAAAH